MKVWKIIFLSKWVICRFHVNLPGCMQFYFMLGTFLHKLWPPARTRGHSQPQSAAEKCSSNITWYLFPVLSHLEHKHLPPLEIYRGLGLWRWVQAGHGDHPPGEWPGSAYNEFVGMTPQASRAKRSKFLRFKVQHPKICWGKDVVNFMVFVVVSWSEMVWAREVVFICFVWWTKSDQQKSLCCVFCMEKSTFKKTCRWKLGFARIYNN